MKFSFKNNDLNFRVYVAATPPETGKQNDIVIISETDMQNWILSPENPKGIPNSDGDVWIKYAVAGNTFNALKNNTLMIATISAWQYVDGVWADVTAKIYQNGKWVDWITYLYKPGDECTNITGGWSRYNGTLTKNGDSLVISNAGVGTSSYAAVYTEKLIDLSNVNELHVVASGSGYSADILATSIVVSKTRTSNKGSVAASADIGFNMGEYTLDVSTLDETYYIGFMVAGSSNVHSMTVQELLMK